MPSVDGPRCGSPLVHRWGLVHHSSEQGPVPDDRAIWPGAGALASGMSHEPSEARGEAYARCVGRGQAQAGGQAQTRREGQGGHEVSICAPLADVRHVLTSLDEIHAWFPLSFEVNGREPKRLRRGRELPARGRLAGRDVQVAICMLKDSAECVHVQLRGPLTLDMETHLRAQGPTCMVRVQASCSPGSGISGRLLGAAASALLHGGGLGRAVEHVRRQAESRAQREGPS